MAFTISPSSPAGIGCNAGPKQIRELGNWTKGLETDDLLSLSHGPDKSVVVLVSRVPGLGSRPLRRGGEARAQVLHGFHHLAEKPRGDRL